MIHNWEDSNMKKVILFQGDSITDGNRSRTDDNNAGNGFVTLIRSAMCFDEPNKYVFYNRGIGGHRITDVYTRITADIINLKPDFLTILIGVNDIWHGIDWQNATGTKRFERIYRIMIEELQEALPNLKIMIMGPYICHGISTDNNEKDPQRFAKFYDGVAEMAAIAQKVAQDTGCSYLPLQEAFSEADEKNGVGFTTLDGVHPGAEGNELIKRLWIKKYREVMGEN